MNSAAHSALESVRVIDLSGTVATEYAAKLFCDYGADVVNIEPEEGFQTRLLPPFIQGTSISALHAYLNANKKSVCGPIEKNYLERFPRKSDLFLYSLDDHKAMEAIAASRANQCCISWYGESGAYSGYKGSDGCIQAMSGLMRGIGAPGEAPIIPPGYQAQIIGGLSAFNGSMAFLLGQLMGNLDEHFKLDCSILEANMCLTDLGPINRLNGNEIPPRMGINRFPPTYPLGVWPCKNGWLGVTALSPSQWKSFCQLLDLDDFIDIDFFDVSINRYMSIDVLEPAILKSLEEKDAEELFYRGQEMRIPLARVPTMEELLEIDQYKTRGAFTPIKSGSKSFLAPSSPFRLLKTPAIDLRVLAELGEHNGYLDKL